MSFFSNLFGKKTPQYPEEVYKITITEDFIKVEHPKQKTEQLSWKDIQEVKLINTDEGPIKVDVWLALIGEKNRCLIPQGTDGFDDIYDIVSKYEGFNYENLLKSMTSTDNEEYLLWKRN